ncbi:hypothetical protein PVAG01_04475 [Phlyctema vagabunda]|uniref:TeaA receptor TeaR n=1 Tax=Phlyctema vagabunda TaxID=108571 RepID=A0ABR4PPG6_9HELO
MAAVSSLHANITPPSSSHGNQSLWNYSVPTQVETPAPSTKNESSYGSARNPLTSQANGNPLAHQTSRPDLLHRRTDNSSHSSKSIHPSEQAYLAPARINALNRKDSSVSDSTSTPDSLLDLYGSKGTMTNGDYGDRGRNRDMYADEDDPEHSRWIHRDKLARIESQELQAAGITLPRSRATSKSSRRERERSRDQQSNGFSRSEQPGQKRQRMGSFPAEYEEEENVNGSMGWDLRTPEEAAQDQGEFYQDMSGGIKGISRIPVAKTSPLPIPVDFLERDTPVLRKQAGGYTGEDDAIAYPKSRNRSSSVPILEETQATPTPAKKVAPEISPTKKTRKTSANSSRVASATQRPKTRSGSMREQNGRPTTRSGETGNTRRPEGDPPWLANMYKPDPRLPPDQQLLPTVARRLQQEQWEKEGKFGNAYDKEFRPLNTEEYPQQQQSEIIPQSVEVPELKPEDNAEWPLRGSKSPALSTGRPSTGTGAGSYSTMPKLQDRGNGQNSVSGVPVAPPIQKEDPVRVQEPAEDASKKGCGCCVVM